MTAQPRPARVRPRQLASPLFRALALAAAGGLLLAGCASPVGGERALVGVWESAEADAANVLSIAPGRVVWRRDGQTQYHLARLTEHGLDLFLYGSIDRVPVRRTSQGLLVGTEPGVLYRPSNLKPAALELEPLVVVEAPQLPADRRKAIAAELIERGERDQAVREELQSGSSSDVVSRMVAIDRENTARMVELLGEVGWIDPERFGDEAARAAFLIVQHSGDKALMAAALPFVRAEWQAGRVPGGHFALMYDRLELGLGRPQLYGSQIFSMGEQPQVVAPLIDPVGVDARRAEVGLQPLAEYLEFFRGETGVPALFDWDLAPVIPTASD
ncbi:DUF6624 domain-containing protein [Engelhardtia mirabilis]|uniref:Uncharacterized protein n=1 Tax=Engelhardtia mirabilis TaxID=2528011 RepID=A0A518BRM3_9BACT|nr:hypothetical protein Pla133_47460 [Planctomycetes bacterium Pla133]QDV03951.1 hypothetical protein Pla86_47440 [Planctomycetes bacterium Pla86]